MLENLGHIVNGKSIHDSGAPIEIFDPSNGEVISTISNASDKIIEKCCPKVFELTKIF